MLMAFPSCSTPLRLHHKRFFPSPLSSTISLPFHLPRLCCCFGEMGHLSKVTPKRCFFFIPLSRNITITFSLLPRISTINIFKPPPSGNLTISFSLPIPSKHHHKWHRCPSPLPSQYHKHFFLFTPPPKKTAPLTSVPFLKAVPQAFPSHCSKLYQKCSPIHHAVSEYSLLSAPSGTIITITHPGRMQIELSGALSHWFVH